jgi:uncharacterized protein YbjT (DUF2867 family)
LRFFAFLRPFAHAFIPRRTPLSPELQRSGLRHTIVRPGGLRSEGAVAPVVLRPAGSYGLPPRAPPSGSILRSQVAALCVAALVTPAAANGVFEARAVPVAWPCAPSRAETRVCVRVCVPSRRR